MSADNNALQNVTVHGTCVAVGARAILLRGLSGAGKSDLALRFLHTEPCIAAEPHSLVADDQVILTQKDKHIIATCPEPLCGLIEVRGLGVIQFDRIVPSAQLEMIVDLVDVCDVPRFPDRTYEIVLGIQIRHLCFFAYEASTPLKLALAMHRKT